MCDEMYNDLTVRCVLENRPVGFEFMSEHLGVDEITVVSQGQITQREIHGQRLYIFQIVAAGCRVAIVPDGHMAGQFLQHGFVKNVSDKAHAFLHEELVSVSRDNPGRLLSPVLQRIQSKVCQISGFFMAEDSEDGALVVKLIGRYDRQFFIHDPWQSAKLDVVQRSLHGERPSIQDHRHR